MKAKGKFSWKIIIRVMILAGLMSGIFNSCQKDEISTEVKNEQAVALKSAVNVEDIDALIEKINEYVEDGLLEAGLANSLISKLENAKKSLEKGNEKSTANQLQAVINQLEDLVSGGTIDAAMGEDLIFYTKIAAGTVWICDTYNVGDYHQGGIIAYIFQPDDQTYIEGERPGYEEGTCHGIIAAQLDHGVASWGCLGQVFMEAWDNPVGGGKKNTEVIVANCDQAGIAARICYDLELNGYDDWFLPCQRELEQLYLQKDVIGGFEKDANYWTSSQYEWENGELAWYFNFGDNIYYYYDTRDKIFRVRAIRYF